MPNGTSAPGNVLPPPLVQVRVSTSAARLLTGWLSVEVFFAPAGSLLRGTGRGQLMRWPLAVVVQAVPWLLPGLLAFMAVPEAGLALPPLTGALGPGLGLVDGLGVVLAVAAGATASTSAAAAAAAAVTNKAGQPNDADMRLRRGDRVAFIEFSSGGSGTEDVVA